MEQLILNVKNKEKVSFLKELVKHLDFVEVAEPIKKKAAKRKHPVQSSIEQGLKEVELVKKGKLKATPLKEFLNEL